jgi:integrase
VSDEKQKRADRGDKQIQRRGVDSSTGKPRYYARFTVGSKRHHVRLYATSMDGARAEFVSGKARVQQGLPFHETPATDALTVRELAERFCGVGDALEGQTVEDPITKRTRAAEKYEIGAAPKGGKAHKASNYRAQFWSVLKCHALDAIGKMDANTVKRSDVLRLVDAMQGKKARTAQKVVRHLSRLYNWSIARDLVTCANPAHKIELPKYAERNDHYTTVEVRNIIAKAKEVAPDLYPIVVFTYYCGARLGEFASLRWGDVDLVGGQAVLARSWHDDERKAGDRVTAHFNPHLLAVMKEHYAKQGRPSGDALVFPNPKNGLMRPKHDAPGECWGLREVVELAKARRFPRPWHSFRHTYATELGAAGASLQVIQEALGQKTLEMARRYTKVAAKQVKAAVRTLPNVVDLAAERRKRKAG